MVDVIAERTRIITVLLGVEGGYSNNPNDSGGPTRWGVTEKVARADGYTGDMKEYPLERAINVYVQNYWNPLRGDDIVVLSSAIIQELFDTNVNCYAGFAAKSLQRCLNVLNDRGKHYPDIEVDGSIGQQTMTCLAAYLTRRGNEGERVLLRMLNSLQGTHYITLAEAREKDETFVYGWFNHRVVI